MQSKIVLIKLVSVLVTVYHIKEKAFIIIKKKKRYCVSSNIEIIPAFQKRIKNIMACFKLLCNYCFLMLIVL